MAVDYVSRGRVNKIIAGTNVTINPTTGDADEVTINSTGAASVHTHTLADVTDEGALAALNTVGTTQIDNDAVTAPKLANMVANTIKGRITASTGDPEDLTAANVRTIINVADGANNYVHPNHSGDVTSVADGATTIASNAVTNAKAAQMATKTYKGRTTAGTGNSEDVAVATLKTDLTLVKGDVGLGNVDNTTDASKPVSTATQTALDAKVATTRTINTTAPLSGGGDLSADRTLTTSIATNKLIGRGTAATGVMEEITLGTNLSFTGTTLNAAGGGGTPAVSVTDETTYEITPAVGTGTNYARQDHTHGSMATPTKTTVGLANVDNTTDAGKPVSTAQQTALDLKSNLASPTFTGTPTLPTGTIATTQSAADSTTKVATTAFVTTADNLKANLAGPTFTGTVTLPASTSLTTPVIGVATGTSLAATGLITSSGTAGIGYATGAGGVVTQATSRATGVTLSKLCGTITMVSAAVAAAASSVFTWTNTLLVAADLVVMQHNSATNASCWKIEVVCAAGTASVTVKNISAASITEATPLKFVVIKTVAA